MKSTSIVVFCNGIIFFVQMLNKNLHVAFGFLIIHQLIEVTYKFKCVPVKPCQCPIVLSTLAHI